MLLYRIRPHILCEPLGRCNRNQQIGDGRGMIVDCESKGSAKVNCRTPIPTACKPLRGCGPDKHMSPESEKTRREFLEEALVQDPHNTFARYGLALELAKTEPAAAWSHFEYLLLHHPQYSATYYQAGMFLVKRGRREEARKVLAEGVEVTGRQGKQHAQAELQAALLDLNEGD